MAFADVQLLNSSVQNTVTVQHFICFLIVESAQI